MLTSFRQRIFPDRPLQYKDVTFPPSTPTSMSAVHIHDNEHIFPNPYKFDPSRWLGPNPPFRFLITWSKGSRQCPGFELSKAEILTTLGTMLTRFGRDMELYDCVRVRDIDTVYDVFNPLPSRDSNGLMVKIHSKYNN